MVRLSHDLLGSCCLVLRVRSLRFVIYLRQINRIKIYVCDCQKSRPLERVMTLLNSATTPKAVYDVKAVPCPSNLGLFFILCDLDQM